jgi:hypothetical protein
MIITTGTFRGDERVAQQTYIGTVDQQQELIRDAQQDTEKEIAAYFAEKYPDDEIAGNEGPTKTNPGYPFSNAAWRPNDGWNAEPWGKWPSSAEARAALALSKDYNSYTQYANDYDNPIRKQHWDSNDDLW